MIEATPHSLLSPLRVSTVDWTGLDRIGLTRDSVDVEQCCAMPDLRLDIQ